MRAPTFWTVTPPTPLARALSPLGGLYGAATGRRMARTGVAIGVPVVCVGNLVVGGAGKTPTVLALLKRLGAFRPAVLSRGYGGSHARAGGTPLRVDPDRDAAALVGDEPLLLARAAPTFVAADRVAAGRQAVAAGAGVLVLDDGLQSPALAKTLSIAVVDGGVGVGNGLCLPAGPLRAPLERQWPHIDLVLIIGEGAAGDAVARQAAAAGRSVTRARLVAHADDAARLAGRDVVAFAGIGRPDKFFESLESVGARVTRRIAFADHHPYDETDVATLLATGGALVTTEKDAVRLTRLMAVETLRVALRFEDPSAIDAALLRAGVVA